MLLMPIAWQKNNAIQLLALDLKVHNPLLDLMTETWFTAKH